MSKEGFEPTYTVKDCEHPDRKTTFSNKNTEQHIIIC